VRTFKIQHANIKAARKESERFVKDIECHTTSDNSDMYMKAPLNFLYLTPQPTIQHEK
jgi:hypothetical protein